jgi:acrylyl-CoA reductase (NADPH)
MFRAILLSKENDQFQAALADLDDAQLQNDELSPGDVTLRIEYSTLNYKDGLAIANQSPVVRKWPMVAGIDGAGVVEASSHSIYKPGDRLILNGWGCGETHWGCLAQKARLKGDWLVPLPVALTTRQAMAIGTAGYTAMLACLALERYGVKREQGEVLVTGASGGVGSIAIAILSGWGYNVVASTGKLAEADYLHSLGAKTIIDRNELSQPGKPMQKERWAGAIDSVGSYTLANVCAQTKYRGVVAACGLAQGMDFPATVAPFILRGVLLAGIDSVYQPLPMRLEAWKRLASDLDKSKLDAITTAIWLSETIARAPDILAGKVRGRLVVDVNA